MSMRISSTLALLACVAACKYEPRPDSPAAGKAGSAGAVAETIGCALHGSEEYSSRCLVERVNRDGKPYIVVRNPDGGFHRFIVHRGAGLTAADGAGALKTARNGTETEVTIGDDHYLLPANPADYAARR